MTTLLAPIVETATLWRTAWESPVGRLLLWVGPRGLARIDLPPGEDHTALRWADRHFSGSALSEVPSDDPHFKETIDQLSAYFAGERREFDLPLDLRGTAFQLAVWNALLTVGWGATASYGDIARLIDNPRAVRAVGAANGANPIPIIVPCHRIIASDGTLHGYGGGLPLKARLLAIEQSKI